MMTDRRNWPWRKKTSRNTSFSTSTYSAVDIPNPNSSSVCPSSKTSPSLETRGADNLVLPMSVEKKRHVSLIENAQAFEELAWKEQAEQKERALTQQLEDAGKDLVSKEAMVKQHAKVAEEAVLGWEKAEAEAVSLKQEVATTMRQRSLLEGRVTELEEALKSSMKQVAEQEKALKSSMKQVAELEEALKASLKQLRRVQEEQQQFTKEAIDRKLQEWGKVKAEMEEVEHDLRQRMLAAEAHSCAMAKSLEERARVITESFEVKARAEMEVGLLQVKLESQATEMAGVRYELRVQTKELEIRNQENEINRKATDAAYKQHLEDVKKIQMLDSECQRLRNLVRKKLPGPAAIAQMKMEADKITEQSKRRRSLGSTGMSAQFSISTSKGSHITERTTSCQDLAEKLLVMEEETKTLRELLAKRNAELHSARKMCARTANKLSVAEELVESLQGTPKSVRSTQDCALDNFLLRSQAMSGSNSERLDDEVSCAESWASALITELAEFKKAKQSTDSCGLDSTSEYLSDTPKKSLLSSNEKPALHGSPSRQDYSTLKTLAAGKDAQLQSANLMCKDAMAKLASAEAKLGGTWISENPRSNVEESVKSVGEAHGIMSKLDRILDGMRIAAASIGDMTDDDNSENGLSISSPSVKGVDTTKSSDLHCMKGQIETQDRNIYELQMQMRALEAAKTELQMQLQVKEEELKQVRCELEDARMRIEELKAAELNSESQQEKLLAEEEAKRGEMQAQLETKQSEVSNLQSSVLSLGVELAEQRKKHEVTITKCEELDQKLQSYVDRELRMATSCRFEEESDVRARKEREVAAAKEKLAECQQTILVLGKQLTAFTSPSSASFDSTSSLHYGPLDTHHHYQEVDHAHKIRARTHQRRPAYNSVNPHDDGISTNPNIHISHSAKKPSHANGGHYSKPRRIQSDLSYRTGSKNPVTGMLFSVADHLQMDDGVSSFYDSRTESAMSSPSSQYTSPNDTNRMQRSGNEGLMGGGVRTSLAKSMERAVADGKSDERCSHGRGDIGKLTANLAASANKNGSYGGGGGGGNGGGGKGSKSLSRFFGRSKK